jgi:hypothetical protein
MAQSIGSIASNAIALAKYVYEKFQLAAQNDENCRELEPALACLWCLLKDIQAETRPTTPNLSNALRVSFSGTSYWLLRR